MVIGRVVQVEALQEQETAVVWNESKAARKLIKGVKACCCGGEIVFFILNTTVSFTVKASM